jgi:predicted cobalt transporter CbtA
VDEPNAISLDLAAIPLVVLAAAFTGWVDLHSDEVQPTVALLMLFTALLAFARPRRPWRWALLMGVAVPLAYVVAPLLGVAPRAQPEPNLSATLIALIPAMIGAYAGVALRYLAHFG